MMVKRRVGNRYTGGTTLTDREARQLARHILALQKLAKKKSRFVGEARELEFIARITYDVIEKADRGYVLTELRIERSAYRL